MENIKLASTTAEFIDIFVQKPSFWAGVFCVKGTYADVITSSSSYANAQDAFYGLIRSLNEEKISDKCIDKLYNSKRELEKLSESGIISKDDLWKLVRGCFDEKERILSIVQSCSSLFSQIEKRYSGIGNEESCTLLRRCSDQLRSGESEFKSCRILLDEFKCNVSDVLETSDATLPSQWKKLLSTEVWNLMYFGILNSENSHHVFSKQAVNWSRYCQKRD